MGEKVEGPKLAPISARVHSLRGMQNALVMRGCCDETSCEYVCVWTGEDDYFS